MKKSTRIKGLMVLGLSAVLTLGVAAGCSSTSTSSSSDSSDAASLEEAYPEHAANCTDGAGIASYHTAMGYDCTTCHGDSLVEQVSAIDDSGEEPALTSTYYDATETCLSSECHVSWENLAEKTADLGDYNPHDSIHGTIQDCNECHKGHSEQVDICGQCHPNGGQTMLH